MKSTVCWPRSTCILFEGTWHWQWSLKNPETGRCYHTSLLCLMSGLSWSLGNVSVISKLCQNHELPLNYCTTWRTPVLSTILKCLEPEVAGSPSWGTGLTGAITLLLFPRSWLALPSSFSLRRKILAASSQRLKLEGEAHLLEEPFGDATKPRLSCLKEG